MVLHSPRTPLRAAELPVPAPGPGQVLLRVPGHQVVASVEELGPGVDRFRPGDRTASG
jgi:NADPH:quinone reductase-like Zn-dependent oxidoreductase